MRRARAAVSASAVFAACLMLMALASPSEAELGCESDPFAYATCSAPEDCGAVGGTDCTAGTICLCTEGPQSPFCPCFVAQAAPVLSIAGLFGLIVLLITVELFRRRRLRLLAQRPAESGR